MIASLEFTPLKFNMEPENQPLEKVIPNLETIIFRFQPLNFGGVYVYTYIVTGCDPPPSKSHQQ